MRSLIMVIVVSIGLVMRVRMMRRELAPRMKLEFQVMMYSACGRAYKRRGGEWTNWLAEIGMEKLRKGQHVMK